MRRRLAAAALALFTLAACDRSDPSTIEAQEGTEATTREASPSTTAARIDGPIRVALQDVGTAANPVNMAVAPDGTVHVVEQQGTIRALRDGRLSSETVLDIRDRVRAGGEQGLLGLAFANDGRHLYVNFTDRMGDTRIVEFPFDGRRADVAKGRQLLFVEQPFPNHNGGHLVMRPDGTLWIPLGDGGSGGDPQNRAQDLGDLLGKILRIDPRPTGGRPYGIPSDNPFVGRAGARPEIWAFGLRNPWRISFDRETNDLWVADVGQNAIEEINRVPAASTGGENYGWPQREGTRVYRQGSAKPAGAIDPVFEYGREGGACAVTGGSVYRGRAIPALVGAYVYGDYCVGRVRALVPRDGRLVDTDLGIDVEGLTSFGEGPDGELFVLGAGDDRVSRLVPAS